MDFQNEIAKLKRNKKRRKENHVTTKKKRNDNIRNEKNEENVLETLRKKKENKVKIQYTAVYYMSSNDTIFSKKLKIFHRSIKLNSNIQMFLQ